MMNPADLRFWTRLREGPLGSVGTGDGRKELKPMSGLDAEWYPNLDADERTTLSQVHGRVSTHSLVRRGCFDSREAATTHQSI